MSEQRPRDPGEVLQAALLDLVQGARAVLDVVEELVTDPAGVARVVETTFGAMRRAADVVTSSRAPERGPEDPAATGSRVTRVRVQ